MTLDRIILLIILSIFLVTWLMGCSYVEPMSHKIEFYKSPCIKPNKDYNYLLCGQVPVKVDDKLIVIDSSFDTDLASIPRPFWNIVSPNQSNLVAPSILHDYLYTCHHQFTRKEVDDIYYQNLISHGVGKVRATIFYWGVRLFGSTHYHPDVNCHPRAPKVLPDSDSNEDGEFITCQDVFRGNATFK